jgi:hypothetical protein
VPLAPSHRKLLEQGYWYSLSLPRFPTQVKPNLFLREIPLESTNMGQFLQHDTKQLDGEAAVLDGMSQRLKRLFSMSTKCWMSTQSLQDASSNMFE